MRTFSRRRLTTFQTALLLSLALLLATLLTTTASPATPPTPITRDLLAPSPLPELPASPALPLSAFSLQHSTLAPLTPISLATKPDLQTYRGKSFRYLKTLSLRVTAYAPDPRCCFPYDGTTTASGLPTTTNRGKLVAADTTLIPFHHLVVVPGYAQNQPVPVLDRGGAIKGHRLDVLLPTFNQAKSWGVQTLKVKIYQPID